MNEMLSGAIAMGFAVSGLIFLRFWRSTDDRFFLFFACSFWLEGLNRLLLGLSRNSHEDVPAYYLIRLMAYALIVLAIWDKNRRRSTISR